MHVDIDGATRIARAAAEFDWTWYIEDIERFCVILGWELTRRGENGASILTNLPINRPKSRVYSQKRKIDYISVWVSDVAGEDGHQGRVLIDGFVEIHAALIEVLGPPTGMLSDDEPEIRWDFPKVVLFISLGDRSINLEIVNPEHQAWKEELKEYEEI